MPCAHDAHPCACWEAPTVEAVVPATPIRSRMPVYCCECGDFLGTKEGLGETRPSHGYCDDCFKALMAEYEHEDGPTEAPATMHALDAISAQESGLEGYWACLRCPATVHGGPVLACPRCGSAMERRYYRRRMPGEVGHA